MGYLDAHEGSTGLSVRWLGAVHLAALMDRAALKYYSAEQRIPSTNLLSRGTPVGLTSRERVMRTCRFEGVDRPARDVWTLPAAFFGREEALQALLDAYPRDFGDSGFQSPEDESPMYEPGSWTDAWGSTWVNIQRGMIGEVKRPALDDWSKLDRWRPPYHLLGKGFEEVNRTCAQSDKFILLGLPRPWERLQFVRGPENAYVDLAWGRREILTLLEMIHDYYMRHLEYVVRTDVDGVSFMDDWGAKDALLISPAMWETYFKPLYKDYVEMAHAHGKLAFMHSDGHILAIYEHLIEIGVDAINSQLFTMPIEEIGARFKGRITFWGELDRQYILPFGTPQDVHAAVQRVKDALWDDRGGVIGQAEFNQGYPLENIRAFFEAWWGEPKR
ncbi:MAG: methyltransferase [Anaerolineae bacterium]|nr:methyltransferase [Anaerolineae bacterium]